MVEKPPSYILLFYFVDVASILIPVMIWGDFPNDNPFMTGTINVLILWMALKTMMYFVAIALSDSYFFKLAVCCLCITSVIFALLCITSLSDITITMPTTNISPEFYENPVLLLQK